MINRIFSWTAVGFLMFLSAIPLRILLLLSPFVAFIMGWVAGYRREVVTTNLTRSFPGKDHKEIEKIRRQFYLHLTDIFFETVSMFFAPRSSVRRRYVPDEEGKALLQSLSEEGTSVIGLAAHVGNWEIIIPVYHDFLHSRIFAVYRPLADKAFDWFLSRIRQRFCESIITDRQVARNLARTRHEHQPVGIGLVADQSPGDQDFVWHTFMHQDTAFYAGPERLIRMFGLPALFLYSRRVSRGHYSVHAELIARHPSELPDGEITRRYIALIEREIRRSPAHYLWSHRRWKKKRELPS